MSTPPAQIILKGPYDESGTVQGPATGLYLGEDAGADTDTDTRKKDIPGLGGDENLLAPLDGQTEFSYSGTFTAKHLKESGVDSSLTDALYRWLFRLESLCLPQQGTGYQLIDQVNGFSRDPSAGDTAVLIEEAEWSTEGGQGLTGDWRVDCTVAEGIQPAEADARSNWISNELSSQGSISREKLEYGGTDITLGTVEDFSITRNLDVEAQKLVHNFDVPQVGVIESGVKVEIRLSGRVKKSQVTDLSTWANTFNTDTHGVESTLYEGLTNRTFGGAVSTTNTEFQGGVPNYVEYDLEFDVGNVTL